LGGSFLSSIHRPMATYYKYSNDPVQVAGAEVHIVTGICMN